MAQLAKVLTFPVESPSERAAHSLTCAGEDVDAAIWQAQTVAELQLIEGLITEMQRRLEISLTVAQTRKEYPE